MIRVGALSWTLLLLGCSPARVPLVYDYPIVAGGGTATDDTVVVEDRRPDTSLDRFIAGGMTATIENVVRRELAARRQTGPDAVPLNLDVQLRETGVDVPRKGGMTAAMLGSVLLTGPLAIALFERADADVHGRVQMAVQATNRTAGARCEDVWNGTATIKTAWSHVDGSQTYARALGAAVKDAVANLPRILRCTSAGPDEHLPSRGAGSERLTDRRGRLRLPDSRPRSICLKGRSAHRT